MSESRISRAAEMVSIHDLRSVFSDFQYDRLWIDAAIEDPRTRIYEESKNRPDRVLLCPHHGICFLSNPHSAPNTSDEEWLKNNLLEVADAGQVKYISVASELWIPFFQVLFPKTLRVIRRISYKFELAKRDKSGKCQPLF